MEPPISRINTNGFDMRNQNLSNLSNLWLKNERINNWYFISNFPVLPSLKKKRIPAEFGGM